MHKHIMLTILCYFLLLSVPQGHTQFPDFISSTFSELIYWANSLQNQLTQIQHAANTLKTQMKVIEQLGKGEFKNVFQGIRYQMSVLADLNIITESQLGDIETLQNHVDDFIQDMNSLENLFSKDYGSLSFSQASELLDAVYNTLPTLSHAAQNAAIVYQNATYRAKEVQDILQHSQNESAVTAQMQTSTQMLSVLSWQLEDIVTNFVQTEQMIQSQMILDELRNRIYEAQEKMLWGKPPSPHLSQATPAIHGFMNRSTKKLQ